MPGRNIKKQSKWLITCNGHPLEVEEHIYSGEIPQRTIKDLDPCHTTYFWLYKENHDECHLYIKL